MTGPTAGVPPKPEDVWRRAGALVNQVAASGLPQVVGSVACSGGGAGGGPPSSGLPDLAVAVLHSCSLAAVRLLSVPPLRAVAAAGGMAAAGGGFNRFGSPQHLVGLAGRFEGVLAAAGAATAGAPPLEWAGRLPLPAAAAVAGEVAADAVAAVAAAVEEALGDAAQRLQLAGAPATLPATAPGGALAARRLLLALPGVCTGAELAAAALQVRRRVEGACLSQGIRTARTRGRECWPV
jgi:hypothetical protein